MTTNQEIVNPTSGKQPHIRRLRIDSQRSLGYADRQDTILERFWDIREQLNDKEPFEVTNKHVLSILMDIYWLHHENSESVRTDGSGQRTVYATRFGGRNRGKAHTDRNCRIIKNYDDSDIISGPPTAFNDDQALCHYCSSYDEINDIPELAADGGQPTTSPTERPKPKQDPYACSQCGTYLGAFSGDYCDACARDIGIKPPLRRCVDCGQRAPEEEMRAVDVSPSDDYYPTFEYVCRSCWNRYGDTA